MPIDDAATRTLRAAGFGIAPRNERLAERAGLRHAVTSAPGTAAHRYCARPTCSRDAVATMSYDQSSCTVYLGGMSPERDPAFYDLCRFHVDRLTPPNGWTIRRVRPSAVSEDGTDQTAATLDGWSSSAVGSARAELTSVLG